MLKLFFNKNSKMVYLMEGIGIITLVILFSKWWPSGKSTLKQIAFFLYVILYIFIRVFASIRFYKNAERFEGIELNFKKVMVPTSYILVVFNLALLAGISGLILYFADVILLFIAHVNVILLYFHIKDKETQPINFFTHNKYLKN